MAESTDFGKWDEDEFQPAAVQESSTESSDRPLSEEFDFEPNSVESKLTGTSEQIFGEELEYKSTHEIFTERSDRPFLEEDEFEPFHQRHDIIPSEISPDRGRLDKKEDDTINSKTVIDFNENKSEYLTEPDSCIAVKKEPNQESTKRRPPPKSKLIEDQGNIQNLFNMARKSQFDPTVEDWPDLGTQSSNAIKDSYKQMPGDQYVKSAKQKEGKDSYNAAVGVPEPSRQSGTKLIGNLSFHNLSKNANNISTHKGMAFLKAQVQSEAKVNEKVSQDSKLPLLGVEALGGNRPYDSKRKANFNDDDAEQKTPRSTTTSKRDLVSVKGNGVRHSPHESSKDVSSRPKSDLRRPPVSKIEDLAVISSSHSAFATVPRDNSVDSSGQDVSAKVGKVQIPTWAQGSSIYNSSYSSATMSDSGSSLNDKEVKDIMFGSLDSSLSPIDRSFDGRTYEQSEAEDSVKANRVQIPEWLRTSEKSLGADKSKHNPITAMGPSSKNKVNNPKLQGLQDLRNEEVVQSKLKNKDIIGLKPAAVVLPNDKVMLCKPVEVPSEQENNSTMFSSWRFEMSEEEILDIKQKKAESQESTSRDPQIKNKASEMVGNKRSEKVLAPHLYNQYLRNQEPILAKSGIKIQNGRSVNDTTEERASKTSWKGNGNSKVMEDPSLSSASIDLRPIKDHIVDAPNGSLQEPDSNSTIFSSWRLEMSDEEILAIKQKRHGGPSQAASLGLQSRPRPTLANSEASGKHSKQYSHDVKSASPRKVSWEKVGAIQQAHTESVEESIAVDAKYNKTSGTSGEKRAVMPSDKNVHHAWRHLTQPGNRGSLMLDVGHEERSELQTKKPGMIEGAFSGMVEVNNSVAIQSAENPATSPSKSTVGKVRIPGWLSDQTLDANQSSPRPNSPRKMERTADVSFSKAHDPLIKDQSKNVAISNTKKDDVKQTQNENMKSEQIEPASSSKLSATISIFNQKQPTFGTAKVPRDDEHKYKSSELAFQEPKSTGDHIQNPNGLTKTGFQLHSTDTGKSSHELDLSNTLSQASNENLKVAEYVSKFNEIRTSPVKTATALEDSDESKVVTFKKLKSLDLSVLGGDLVSKNKEKKAVVIGSDSVHQHPEVPRSAVAQLLGNYTGRTSSSAGGQATTIDRQGPKYSENTRGNKTSASEQPRAKVQDNLGKTFTVGYAVQEQDLHRNLLDQIKHFSFPQGKSPTGDDKMNDNDVLKGHSLKGFGKGQDWGFRDDGYWSPRTEELLSLSSSSVSDDYRQSLDSSLGENDDRKMSSQKYYPTFVGNVAVSAKAPTKGNATSSLMAITSTEETGARNDIHYKLELMLQRRLHGQPGFRKPPSILSENSYQADLSNQGNRPKTAVDAKARSVSFQGFQDGYEATKGFHNSGGEQAHFSKTENIEGDRKKVLIDPNMTASHKYSDSTKIRKHKVLQELATAFKTPDDDEKQTASEELSATWNALKYEPESSNELMGDNLKKFKNNTLRDTHVDSDTRPIDKDKVVQMLARHLAGDPDISDKNQKNAVGKLSSLKRGSVYDVFKFTSDDIRSDLGDTVDNIDEDAEVIKAFSQGKYKAEEGLMQYQTQRESKGYSIPLATSSPTFLQVSPHVPAATSNSNKNLSGERIYNGELTSHGITLSKDKSAKLDLRPSTGASTSNYFPSHGEKTVERKTQSDQHSLLQKQTLPQSNFSVLESQKDLSKSKYPDGLDYSVSAATPISATQQFQENGDVTEYYDPKHNDESVIKPSQFKRHNFGSSIIRPIHIHQNIPGTDAPPYVPQGISRQALANLEKERALELDLQISSEHSETHNHQTFSEIMGLSDSAQTQSSYTVTDPNVIYQNKTVQMEETLGTLVTSDGSLNRNAKEKWYNSWRHRKSKKDKVYISDSESSSSSKSTPRSPSPMSAVFKSLGAKFSPSPNRKAVAVSKDEDAKLFMPGSKDDIQRRIHMNGVLNVSNSNDVSVNSNEIDDVASGDFVSAKDWLEKQREGFDFRCVRPEKQNGKFKNTKDIEATNMPQIKPSLVSGPSTPSRRKAKASIKKESIGKVIVPAAFSGSDHLSTKNDLLAADLKAKWTSTPNNLNLSNTDEYKERRESNSAAVNGYANEHGRSRAVLRSGSMNNINVEHSSKNLNTQGFQATFL